MPVKVRCPGCEKLLNAPDRARGKKVKCPQCGTSVGVPVEKVAKRSAPPSSSAMIATLDLDRVEDSQNRICPKCGAEVTPEDQECPECHVDLQTGLLSAKNKAELSRRGPDPKLYYKEFFKDSAEFWKKNLSVSWRLAGLCVLFTAVSIICVAAAFWTVKPLARYFFYICAVLALLVPPGLVWDLHTTIIDLTLRKKKKITKYRFDKFLGAALGLKLIFWTVAIALPLHVLAIVFLVVRFPLVAGILEGCALVFAALLFPIAMSHMAMPVTIRGWMLNKLSAPFFRTIPAVMYWALFLFLAIIPPLALVGGAALVGAETVRGAFDAAHENMMIYRAKVEIADLPKGAQIPPELEAYERIEPVSLDWPRLSIPAAMLILAAGIFGVTPVFLMRANGLFTYYFRDRLDLETMAPEVTYVPTAKSLDDLEARQGLTWKPVITGIAASFAVGVALGGSVGMSSTSGFTYGAVCGMMIAGGGAAAVGFFWVMFEAFQDSMMWFGAIQLGWPVSGTVFMLTGMQYSGILSILPAIVYGMVNWSTTKYATVVMMSGFVYFSVGYAVFKQMFGADV